MMSLLSLLRLLPACAAALVFSVPVFAGSLRAFKDTGQFVKIDVPNAEYTEATAINEHGAIAGLWEDASGGVHGFVRAIDGAITTFDPTGAQVTWPIAINDKGTVVGYYQDQTFAVHGLIRKPSGKMDTLSGESIHAATAINVRGDICGSLDDGQGFVRTRNGRLTEIDPPGSVAGDARAISDTDTVAGWFKDAGGHNHGFVRAPDGTLNSFDVPKSIGTVAYGMNKSGAVVGSYIDKQNASHGYIRDAGGALTKFSLDRKATVTEVDALSINSTGTISGYYRSPETQKFVAFMRTPDGKISRLKPRGEVSVLADAINDNGAIVGAFVTSDDIGHGYLRLP